LDDRHGGVVTTPLTPFLVGVIGFLWLADIEPWFTIKFQSPTRCLEFPFSFRRSFGHSPSCSELRANPFGSPLLIASGIAIGHLSETEISFRSLVTLQNS